MFMPTVTEFKKYIPAWLDKRRKNPPKGKLYAHYKDFAGPWLWPNFTPQELACRHCGEYYHDPASLDRLQALRDLLGAPIRINSAHRCAAHNRKVGGVGNSPHLQIAFDCRCPKKDQIRFVRLAERVGFKGIGMYPARNFIHLDMGKERDWWG
ncbi:D-Ala-D-Ala carboxypeptidase family metallohydrolase [Desulfovibrio sp. OttesenSCG-928-G15]|nr:D-Ala-D-Ala carboxypeptidase family metallohydrolase [Desulfovibrio sp. OttesenSCG-928-G15]